MVIDHQKKHPYSGQSVHRQRPEKTALERPPAYPAPTVNPACAAAAGHAGADMCCECNQSDDAFGAVVRQLQKPSARGDISGGAVAPLFTAPARRRWLPYYVLKRAIPARICSLCRIMISSLFGASPESR